MTYVIAEPCIGTKDTACVDACPVDCIHPKKDEAKYGETDQLFIDPVECIDCGACVPVCPVSAIFAGENSRHRADGNAGAAVDTFHRIDEELVGFTILRFIFLGMNAVYRASVDAGCVL